ncbi:lysophospholipid acyltransferase family protein [Acerihabitans arboris]|uniref:1-acyl-sn-glycerol-3-phosphate acyltransferase n=1 Tax=Acerihabitans arboris TaxID=2691583 RepID=A0A845ST04_9GAMM|nr:lysophospholipid acyltransferase family protein [Acerihabitans arboris]NDL65631.1 1-acyl-sn-glycerol-3-phosphate acyltransferase [Acerihabitans arboris]
MNTRVVTPVVRRPDNHLKFVWRMLMTGGCFALFGIGGLLLTAWFHILCLRQKNPARRTQLARRVISWSFRLFLAVTRRLGVLDYHIRGAHLLRQDRGNLVLANHPTLLDYVLLASVMPQCDCVVKQALLDNVYVSGAIRAADYLINSQAEILLAESEKRLRAGDSLLIFPEGTRSPHGAPMKLQRGAANLAVRSGCDIRIVHIYCSQRFLSKGSKWYQIPRTKPQFTVEVKARFSAGDFFSQGDRSPALAARRLTQHLAGVLVPENSQSFEIT